MKTPEDAKLFDFMVSALTSGFGATDALAKGDTESYNHFKAMEDAALEGLGLKDDEKD